MSRRRRSRYENYWPAYVSVAERRANAERTLKKMKKKDEDLRPVTIEGRTIASTFWGKGWCNHLESFGDYSNRLPRGRSYVRNGSVCHLDITLGRVAARVAGSSLYSVQVEIKPLASKQWQTIKTRCAGRIGSLIELLQGKLSDEIMGTVVDPKEGLFPLPGQIKFTCDCPDWAKMCKHVSAVMYGIGARLDEQPELLFLLRGVDHNDLISGETNAAAALAGDGSRRSRRRKMAEADMAAVFGVEVESEPAAAAATDIPPSDMAGLLDHSEKISSIRTTKAHPISRPGTEKSVVFKATGKNVARLRESLCMSIAAFARAAGVSPASITKWERCDGAIRLQAGSLAGLRRLHDQTVAAQPVKSKRRKIKMRKKYD